MSPELFEDVISVMTPRTDLAIHQVVGDQNFPILVI